MSSPAGNDYLEVQRVYIANYYNLFDIFMKNLPTVPPATSPKDSMPSHQPNRDALPKDTFVCRLCGSAYDTPRQLAHHNCPQLTRAAFQCQNCHKGSNCSANLASHQRWHRPKSSTSSSSSRKGPSQIQFDKLDLSTDIDLINTSISATSSSNDQPVKTTANIIRSPCERTLNHRTPGFSIDSILETPKSTFACFRCDETLHSQSDFEDHIIDHMLCTQAK